MKQKQFDCFATALAMGVSVALVKTYPEIFEEHKDRAEFQRRIEEIEIVGGKFYEASDFEKGGPSQNVSVKKGSKKR